MVSRDRARGWRADGLCDRAADLSALADVVPGVWRDPELPALCAGPEEPLRVSEAFPRKPQPRHEPATAEEIAQARDDFALHIPSLLHGRCLAEGCGEWPCERYRQAVAVLDRAGLLDVNGQLRG